MRVCVVITGCSYFCYNGTCAFLKITVAKLHSEKPQGLMGEKRGQGQSTQKCCVMEEKKKLERT